jgi:DNA-binding NtrC family response regulator
MNCILIVEDETVIRSALRRLLERHGFQVIEAGSVADAQEHCDLGNFDLVIADLHLPGKPGTELIRLCDNVPVLIMTSYASIQSAVDSMKMGAADYIAKPFDHEELVLRVERIIQRQRLQRQNAALKSDLQRTYPVAGMVGECTAMREVFARVCKVAPTDTTVLILGESGTGKELVARALHESSQRADAPIIAVNCASIPEGIIESELFGHERGVFTGAVRAHPGLVESADSGTLFLDEIGELSLATQAQLLRVLQEGEIHRVGSIRSRRMDVRLIAATHRDLEAWVRKGKFCEDLYYRLRVVEIPLPPLRERGDDIARLAKFLLEKTCRRLNRQTLKFSAEAMDTIQQHRWPGNVRELENAIERAVILCDAPLITPELLAIKPIAMNHGSVQCLKPVEDLSLDDYFRRFVLEHQKHTTETELARQLGISRKALWERRQRMGIPRPGKKTL